MHQARQKADLHTTRVLTVPFERDVVHRTASKGFIDKQLVSSKGNSKSAHRTHKFDTLSGPLGTKLDGPVSLGFDTKFDPIIRGSTGSSKLDRISDEINIVAPVNETNLAKEPQRVDRRDGLFATEPMLQGKKRGRFIFDSGIVNIAPPKRPRLNAAAQDQSGYSPTQHTSYPHTADLSDYKGIPVQRLHPRFVSHLSSQRHYPTTLDRQPAHFLAELQKEPLTIYLCNHCPPSDSAGYLTSDDLVRHRKGVHGIYEPGDKVWRCQIADCVAAGKIWPRRDNFFSHLKRMHFNDDDNKVREMIDKFQESYDPKDHTSFGFTKKGALIQKDLELGEEPMQRGRLHFGNTQGIEWNVKVRDVGRTNDRMALRWTSSISEDTVRQQPFTTGMIRQQRIMHVRHDNKVHEPTANPKPSPLNEVGRIRHAEALVPKFNRNGIFRPKFRFDTLSQDRSRGEKQMLLCALSKRTGMLDAARTLWSDIARTGEFC